METQLKGIRTSKTAVQPAVRPKRKSLNKFVTISLFLAPAIIIYIIYVLYPIFSTLLYSFYDWDGVGAGTYVGLQNYANLLNDSIFWTSMRNNTWVVLTSVFVQIPLGLIMALMLLAPIRGIRLFSGVYFFPFLISTVAVGLLWMLMLDPLNGIINQLVSLFGFENVEWLSQSHTAMFAVLLVIIWQFSPFYMILFKAAIVGIPEELYEAAEIDGANAFTKFFRITFPLLMPTIVSSSILAIVGSLKAFDIFYVMTGGGPNHGTELLGTYMFKQAFINFNMGYASAIAFVMFFLALIVTVIIQALDFYRKKKGAYA
ncbi:sugar ABC transporter permease [Metabacillus idriensis]|uniref:ABC transporter permease subunit n=1 Tax=Metabacillus idriensis TaxID=324768 RepID=A0A6I2M7T2_9BACI|nr:sugar ABC transporter permease [Metabacillus idriensis]MCM3595484.1 sugar ABC transporter permease [Metabacillus idriensis]MRX52491.1 ABC transporter permease subunit [Metabacillus idriensis]OHR63582.1 ABC transporter permease [Bacillus sp. HMSC76G11]